MMNELHQECHVACFSETTNAAIFHYSLTGVKDKLLEDWVGKLSTTFWFFKEHWIVRRLEHFRLIQVWPLEDWKEGKAQIGMMTPKFQKDADLSQHSAPRVPQLKLCTMDSSGNLSIPRETRDKWLADPIRSALTLPLIFFLEIVDFCNLTRVCILSLLFAFYLLVDWYQSYMLQPRSGLAGAIEKLRLSFQQQHFIARPPRTQASRCRAWSLSGTSSTK